MMAERCVLLESLADAPDRGHADVLCLSSRVLNSPIPTVAAAARNFNSSMCGSPMRRTRVHDGLLRRMILG